MSDLVTYPLSVYCFRMSLLKLASKESVVGQELQKHRALLMKEARLVALKIKSELPVLQIFLIGSLLNGSVDYDSDIDLVLVVKDPLDVEGVRKSAHAVRWSQYPLDLIVIPQADLTDPSKRNGIVSEVIAAGLEML